VCPPFPRPPENVQNPALPVSEISNLYSNLLDYVRGIGRVIFTSGRSRASFVLLQTRPAVDRPYRTVRPIRASAGVRYDRRRSHPGCLAGPVRLPGDSRDHLAGTDQSSGGGVAWGLGGPGYLIWKRGLTVRVCRIKALAKR